MNENHESGHFAHKPLNALNGKDKENLLSLINHFDADK